MRCVLRDGSEDISLSDVLTLVFANDDYDVRLVPQEAIDAVSGRAGSLTLHARTRGPSARRDPR